MEKLHFGDRLLAASDARRSQVVVGLDPQIGLLPDDIVERATAEHGRTPSGAAAAILRFNLGVLEAVSDIAVAVKPQVAFYERFGSEGLRAYGQTIREAHARGLIVIGDVKRGDIGSTAEAYAHAHLSGPAAGEPWDAAELRADAVTVNPFFGSDGVRPFLEQAGQSGCGVFVLVKTSNPSSVEVQDLDCGGKPLYEHLGALVEEWGRPYVGGSGYSLVGAVVGATFPRELAALRRVMPHAVLLVPGFGAQGGGVQDVLAAFDPSGRGAVISSSRAVIYAYRGEPYARKCVMKDWKVAVREAAEDMRREIWQATHGG